MRWIALLAFFLVLTGSALAAGSDEQYLDIYNGILQADSLLQNGQQEAAALRYVQAQTDLQKLHAEHPTWNPDVVKYRLDYLTEKLQALSKFVAATNAVPSAVTAPAKPLAVAAPVPAQPSTAALEQQIAGLQVQIRSLSDANVELQGKLKEALSVQPASVSPAELAKAEEKIVALQKERDLLAVALEQEKAANSLKAARPAEVQPAESPKLAPEERDQLKQLQADIAKDEAEIARLKHSLVEAEKKLAAANQELESVKTSRTAEAQSTADTKGLGEERDKLKAELAERSKDLAEAEAHNNAELFRLRAALQQAEQRRDELEKKLAAAPPEQSARETTVPAQPEKSASARQVEQLQARIAVLEAEPVPYTAEELALLKKVPAPLPAELPKTALPDRHVYSSSDLPPGAGGLWADALNALIEHDYAAAEKKFNEVLLQDEKNVYVLDHLADAQFGAGQLAECEKTVQRSLALDPDAAAGLYLLGLLRYRQDRLDEALDALSRSAKLNPTNSTTQNFLGCVLADKGLRPAAETALRKALQCDPENGDAHYNLAVIYAGNKPPSLELARWHYKRAVALGHAKSETLDKLLAGSP